MRFRVQTSSHPPSSAPSVNIRCYGVTEVMWIVELWWKMLKGPTFIKTKKKKESFECYQCSLHFQSSTHPRPIQVSIFKFLAFYWFKEEVELNFDINETGYDEAPIVEDPVSGKGLSTYG